MEAKKRTKNYYPPKQSLNNLKPLNKRTPEEKFAIQSMGGKANKGNEKSILGQKLRRLKEKGLTADNAKRLEELMTHPELNALDLKLFIEKIKKGAHSVAQQLSLANTMIQWHKMTFGDKLKVESTNININFNAEMSSDESDKLLDFIGGK